MLAKPLKRVDRPDQIVTEISGLKYGETAFSKRTQSMNSSRRENRNFPRVNRPRKKVVEVQGKTARCAVTSIDEIAMVRSDWLHRGMLLWRVSREALSNLGEPWKTLDIRKPKVLEGTTRSTPCKLNLTNPRPDCAI